MLKNRFLDFSTIISKSTCVNGSIESVKSISVEGEVTGNIFSKQKVRVHQKGIVGNNIKAKDCEIFGEVKGSVEAENLLIVSENGIVHGNIVCKKIQLHRNSKLTYFQETDLLAEQKNDE